MDCRNYGICKDRSKNCEFEVKKRKFKKTWDQNFSTQGQLVSENSEIVAISKSKITGVQIM